MPIIKFKTKDEIPEGLRELAKEADGAFAVDVVAKTKLDEFRDTNISLSRERDELKNKVDKYASVVGEDPDSFAGELNEMRSVHQQVKDGKLKGSSAVEEEVTRRVASVKEGYDTQLRNAIAERDREKGRADQADGLYRRSIIDREITNAVLAKESGVNPTALPDILSRAYGLYQVNEKGQLVAKNGDVVVYGSDGATPLQPKEWLQKLVHDAPHFAIPSSGGGAAGNTGSKLPDGMSQEVWDKLSPQERITRARKAQTR